MTKSAKAFSSEVDPAHVKKMQSAEEESRFRGGGNGSRRILHLLRACMILPLIIAMPGANAQDEDKPTVEKLLKGGWSVAGYAAQGTTYILFKHDDQDYLVQCSVLYDTTRGTRAMERVKTNCYELH
jgi:hypothetical protein